jgi:Flp pilus assembly protein TadG
MAARRGGPGRRPDARGQVIVLVVFGMVALMAGAGLAFDVGRFFSERRFLQNAADAGALAVANALIRGETSTDAEAEGRDILARNLLASPTGTTAVVATTPEYLTGHPGDPAYLTSGILITSGQVRVAIRSDVTYTFGRAIGLGDARIGAQARVDTIGDLLPIAVRHFINAPGPTVGASAPCDGNTHDFQDLVATANTSCLGTATDATLRSTPNPGLPFNASNPNDDPTNHGPIIALVGQGADPSNAASFRGFVALDIRNFEGATSNLFYNGVSVGMTANTIADVEAGWVATGYPGPQFPPVTSPPDPNDQVGILDGNKSGIIIDAIDGRYDPGSEILAAVYSGTVMNIPDFAMTVPSMVTINQNQNRNGSVTMSVSKNAAFAGVVESSAFANWNDPTNPYGTTLLPFTFSPSPITPAGTVTWTQFQTSGAPQGIYTVWVQGHSSSPYLTDHYYPVAVKIGSVNRDFSTTGSGSVISVPNTGLTGTGTFQVATPNNNSTYFGGDVTVTVEGGPQSNGVLPVGMGTVTVSPSTFTLTKGLTQDVTVTIDGGTLSLTPGEYPLTLRVTGTNQTGEPVTRMIPFTFDIATAGTSDEYVDILGWTVFRITSMDSNTIYGYAISGLYTDMNDSALRRGQVARLVPWN